MSNHFPILLDGGGVRRGFASFHFENMWLKKEEFEELLKSWWKGFIFSGSCRFILVEKLKALKADLKIWNKEVFGKVMVRKSLTQLRNYLKIFTLWLKTNFKDKYVFFILIMDQNILMSS